MKEDYKSKGVTMLEMVVSLVIFTLLLGALWQFFSSTFITYKQFDNRTNLSDHSRLVSSFIREEIRSSDKVTIIVASPAGLITPPLLTPGSVSVSGILVKIELDNSNPTSRKGNRSIELRPISSPTNGQGEFELVYEANSTRSVISDKIGNIKVSREPDSQIVEFECSLHQDKEVNERQKVMNIFSESLEYKEAH